MSKVIKCDAIFPGCEGVVEADSDEAVMELAAKHAAEVHGVHEIDEATAGKVREAIVTK